ncbi:MAG: ATP-grasp domain-containing protein, partial [Syntrophothermus sp.]
MSAGTVAGPVADAPARMAVVAMAGAGQLAQMTHQAAISLGVGLRVLGGGEADCAVAAGAPALIASRPGRAELEALAAGADVLTFDNERFPPDVLAALERDGVRLAPTAAAQLFAQDKLHGRRRLRELGFAVPPFAHVQTEAEIDEFAERHGWPLVGKAARGGYDGRGVFPLADRAAAAAALRRAPGGLLVEPRLPIERELAVLLART